MKLTPFQQAIAENAGEVVDQSRETILAYDSAGKLLHADSPEAKAANAAHRACKGINCGTTTGNHSPECLAQYEKAVGIEPDGIEAVIACLGDDASGLRDDGYSPEVADNMERAAELLGFVQSHQGAEAVRLLGLVRNFVLNQCEKPLQLQTVLNVIDLAAKEAAGMAAGEFTQVLKRDASAYSEILSLLGMEEEGDAVAAVSELIAGNARYIFLRNQADKSKAVNEALDAECDAGIVDAVEGFARAMYPRAPS